MKNLLEVQVSRREFLKVAIAALVASCGRVEPSSLPEVTNTPTPPLEPTLYPEISGYPIYDRGRFTTEKGTTYTWFNYTQLRFNQEVASQTLSYFQNLFPETGQTGVIIEPENGSQIPVLPLRRKLDKPVQLFVVPYEAPRANFLGETELNGSLPSGQTFTDAQGTYAMIIRYLPTAHEQFFSPDSLYINKVFATEACQAATIVYANEGTMARLGQETICNSTGSAFSAKQNDLSYQRYASIANSARLGSFRTKMVVVAANGYERIPTVGAIFTQR